MKPIEVDNVTYRSVAEAHRALSPPGLRLVTVRWRLREGWDPAQALMYSIIPAENRRGFKDIRTGISALQELRAAH
jgi:hypothetical protein